MLTIDGSQGEGGGQILRTALSLSMITGTPFRIERIRARRAKPGLLRQHLTCVTAARDICGGKVRGAGIGSQSLVFEPGDIRGGEYTFAVGTAGSTCLVFQTLLPALMKADAASRVTLHGGTHNPAAPAFDYLDRVFLPLLRRMGANVEAKLHTHGFFPAGGGHWHAAISPSPVLVPLILEEAGPVTVRRITAVVANLPFGVAEREAASVAALLSWPPESIEARTVQSDGHGNVLTVELGCEHVTEMFTGFGTRGLTAEAVAEHTVAGVRAYLAALVPVGPHLADQILLPCALAGGGSFVTMEPAPTGG